VADATHDDRLQRLEALTDPALARLDTDDLYAELLTRVRLMLGVDTATILILDAAAEQLVAVASNGLEDEVRHNFRLDVGHGFAGQVAASRAPRVLAQVDATTVANPVLAAKGLRRLLGVPMIAGDDLVGVLHVGSLLDRQFTSQDISLLQVVADRIALASRARRADADRSATLALQRSLLPTRLPRTSGFDLAARYLPGHAIGVGGDWYDVFTLPSGRLGLVVGDVAGSGLRAAVVMGRMRSALRAYAIDTDDPAEVLTRLDRKIRYFEAGNLATVLYATLDSATGEMAISLSGHLPPAMAAPEQKAEILTLAADVPVGVGDSRTRRCTTVTLPPGAVLVAYTDGLVERRGESIDLGLERLCSQLTPEAPETVCSTVIDALVDDTQSDDIAVVAVRRPR